MKEIIQKKKLGNSRGFIANLKRIESRNVNENYLYYHLADSILRHEKSFEDLYNDLKNNLIY